MKFVFLLPALCFMVHGAVPSFQEPFLVQADGSDLDVGLIAEPFMVDWDGDGVTDLLVGQFSPGKVGFYRNTGTNQDPVFTFSNYLQADGSDIAVSAG